MQTQAGMGQISEMYHTAQEVTTMFDLFQKCKVEEGEVHHALLSGDPQDQLVIAYNLVIDNKKIADESK